MQFNHNGKEIAPCIVSKARFALSLKVKRPSNEKLCSKQYWENAIRTIAVVSKVPPTVSIEDAIAKYDEMILKKVSY